MNNANSNTETSKNQRLAQEAIDLAGSAASFCSDNIYPVLDALVGLADFDSQDLGANRVRIGLIKNLAKVGRQLVDEAAAHMESEVRERQSALRGGLSLAGGAQ